MLRRFLETLLSLLLEPLSFGFCPDPELAEELARESLRESFRKEDFWSLNNFEAETIQKLRSRLVRLARLLSWRALFGLSSPVLRFIGQVLPSRLEDSPQYVYAIGQARLISLEELGYFLFLRFGQSKEEAIQKALQALEAPERI